MALSCELIINLQIIRNFRASRVQWDQYYKPDLAVMQLQLKICQFLIPIRAPLKFLPSEEERKKRDEDLKNKKVNKSSNYMKKNQLVDV